MYGKGITPQDEVRDLLAQLYHQLHHKGHPRDSIGQGRILSVVYDEGPMTITALSQRLGIMTGSLSEMVIKLESKGLLLKDRHDEDKRKVYVSISDLGRQHVETFRANNHRKQLLSCLSEEEMNTLKTILKKILTDIAE